MAKDIPPEKKGELAKEEEERFVAMVVAFARAVLQSHVYGAEHPLSQKMLGDCYGLLEDAIRGKEELIIYTLEGKMYWKGFPIAEKYPAVKRLVELFGKNRVVSIGFNERITSLELTAFLGIFSMRPEDILTSGGVEKLMSEKGVKYIRINPVTYELKKDIDEKVKATIKGEEEEEEAASEMSVESEDYKGEKALEGEAGFSDEDLAAGRKKPRILIVDEDVEFLASMKDLLQPEGYAVATTRSIDVGLKVLQGGIDLVICSGGPRIDAIKLLELITRDYPGTLKILMTAQPDPDLAMEAINRTALYKFIIKPWDTREMKRTLKFAFRQRKVIIADELLSEEIKRREAEFRQDKEKLSRWADK